jgi:hypothetical protein
MLYESYALFKATSVRPAASAVDATINESAAVDEPSESGAASAAARARDDNVSASACVSASAARVSFLQFFLLFSLSSGACRLLERSGVARVVPLYGLLKLLATAALVAPNQQWRQWMVDRTEPYLARVDQVAQVHLVRAARRSAFVAHKSLLSALGWLMSSHSGGSGANTLPYLSDAQLEQVSEEAAALVRATKQEKTRRLVASVRQLPIAGLLLAAAPPAAEVAEDASEDVAGQSLSEVAVANPMPVSDDIHCYVPASATHLRDDEGAAHDLDPIAGAASGESKENADPGLDETVRFANASFVSPAGSPLRGAFLASPSTVPSAASASSSHLRTPSQLLRSTTASSAGAPLTPSSSSVLSQRLALLDAHGNEAAMLRERAAHTPQKVKLWTTAAAAEGAGNSDHPANPAAVAADLSWQARAKRQTIV